MCWHQEILFKGISNERIDICFKNTSLKTYCIYLLISPTTTSVWNHLIRGLAKLIILRFMWYDMEIVLTFNKSFHFIIYFYACVRVLNWRAWCRLIRYFWLFIMYILCFCRQGRLEGDDCGGDAGARPRPAAGGELCRHEAHRQRQLRRRLPGQTLRHRRTHSHQKGAPRQEV